VDTIGLGVNPVSPIEMASAYATVAAQGVYRRPYAIDSVRFPSGRVDNGWQPRHGRQVIPAPVAYEVTRVLEGVIAHGTGTAANLGRAAAGKTGTTESLADAWFDGYTPALAAAVWVGYPRARVPMKHVHGIEVFGGTFPARIWRTFMLAALRDRRPGFAPPPGSVHWRRWCGRFQYARSYADARSTGRCETKTTTKKRTTTEKTTTRPTTTTTTITRATTLPTTTAPPRPRTTTTAPPTTSPPPQTTTTQPPPQTTTSPPPTTTAPPPTTTTTKGKP
jgi:membrane peptidoglycan carboxypeptidase